MYLLKPTQQVKLVYEMAFFMLVLVPGILWAFAKKFVPPKRKSVKGQVVLITGAARGLGRELATRFAGLGAKIACLDIDEPGTAETVQIIRETGGVASGYKCDVSKRDQIKDVHRRIVDEIGPVDILINNAAIVWGHWYVDPNRDQFIDDIIDVNIKGQFWMNREILPSMMERNSGHIVALSSLSSMAGVPGISAYTATKYATNGMMECLRNELDELRLFGVKTTTTLPYFISTNPTISKVLDIRFQEIPIKVAGSQIVRGILENKSVFTIPYYIFPFVKASRLLPDNLQNLLKNICHARLIPSSAEKSFIDRYRR